MKYTTAKPRTQKPGDNKQTRTRRVFICSLQRMENIENDDNANDPSTRPETL